MRATALLYVAFPWAEGASNNIPPLEGATQTGKPQQDNGGVMIAPLYTKFETSEGSANHGNSGGGQYEYRLQINATVPYEYRNGEPIIDQCVDWVPNSNPDNFTWYGLRIQLSDEATTGSGGYLTGVTKATQELGLVQAFNSTQNENTRLLEYNITTPESQPLIHINFNDKPFWETYKFDFVEQGSAVSDGTMYQEFVRTLYGEVACYSVPEDTWPKPVLNPVVPTLTISLLRFDNEDGGSGGGDNPPSPSPSPPASSSAQPPMGKFHSLGVAAMIAAVWMITV